jgi:hypothetical protein
MKVLSEEQAETLRKKMPKKQRRQYRSLRRLSTGEQQGNRAQRRTLERQGTRPHVAATRLQIRGVGHLPLDRDRACFELTEEERARRASRPNTRRWRALDRLDAEVDRLQQKRADSMSRRQEAEDSVARAPQEDARSLATWFASGRRASGRPRRCTNASENAMRHA